MKSGAIILAGGLGTRLRSVVANRPKVLARVNGRPFITHILDQLAEAGIPEVIISTGYMADMIQSEIGSVYKTTRIEYSRETEPLGTGGGTKLALNCTNSDPILVLNGDSYCEVDFHELIREHGSKNATATITLAKMPDTSRFGRVTIDPAGQVLRFEEKSGEHSEGWINAGVYCLQRFVIESIHGNKAVSIEREIFPGLIGNGLHTYQSTGKFIDIGTPESYADAAHFFK